MGFLLLYSTASTAQTKSSAEVICDKEQPERCSSNIVKGQPAPLTGVGMTTAMALAFKARLDEAVARIDEEKRYCSELRGIDAQATAAKVRVLEQSTTDQVALVQQALDKERERSKQLAAEVEVERFNQWLWAAGGVGVGVLAGAAVALGGVVYWQTQAP